MARYIEYHGETDSRDGSSQHVFIIGVMGNHGQVADKVVDATKLDGKGYAYCYKTEATYGTEIALKFSLLNDDKGEYSGIVSVEAMVGYYEIIDMFMKVDPNEE